MALYRHVVDKDAFLDGVLEPVVTQIEMPATSLAWDERLTRLAQAVRATGHRHPTARGLAFGRPGDTPAVRRLVGIIHGARVVAGP